MTGRIAEAKLERIFAEKVRLAGGIPVKTVAVIAGTPDRYVIWPGGRIDLVELKALDGHLSAIQRHWHARAAELGVNVHVLYGKDEITEWIRRRVQEEDPLPQRAGRPRRWTPDEVAAILAPDRPSDHVLAVELGRSVQSIVSKRAAS